MNPPTFYRYFGRTARFDRACVEMRFAVGGETYSLAGFEPMLLDLGFKLREFLPEEPLPLDAAVCRLASALLARHRLWWSDHGADDATGWAAIEFPFPGICAAMLRTVHGLVTAGDAVPETVHSGLRELSAWLSSVSKVRMWLRGAAALHERDTIPLLDAHSVHQIGHGAKGVHGVHVGTQYDSLTGLRLDENKFVAVQLLRRLGIPTTAPVLVQRPQDVPAAIARVGFPCVVKPLNLSKGEGVAPGLASEAQVVSAVERALKLARPPVLVENHVEGFAHRLIVVAHQLLWAYRRNPTSVVGDGTATIRQLIERENRRRSSLRVGNEAYLFPVALNEALERLLADRHGLGLDSVLEAGREIQVVAQANVSQGGLQKDVTAQVHPDNRALAVKISRLFRLNAVGIDFITPDIARSWKEIPCAVIEVNRLPGLEGYADAVLIHRTLFSNRRSGRIPTVAVIGSERYRAQAAEAALTAFAGNGLRADQATYSGGAANAPQPIAAAFEVPAVDTLMLDPMLEAAVVLCEPEGVERAGFPLRRCDLLLVEEKGSFDWLYPAADAIMAGPPSAALTKAIGRLAKTYADPAEGGPLPVLEPVESAGNEFRLKAWRVRAIPRAWFWEQAGIASPRTDGMATEEDLLAAVVALAKAEGVKLPDAFAHSELPSGWARVTFDATLALPKKNAAAARAALLAATERVNAIAGMKLD